MPDSASALPSRTSRPLPLTMQAHVVRLLDYIDVEVTGTLDLPGLVKLIRKLGILTREQGDKRILFDLLDVEGEPHVAGQMQVGEEIAQSLGHMSHIASVVPKDRITRASEAIAQARGVRLKVFDSKDEAIVWLRTTSTDATKDSSLDAVRAAIWSAVRHLFPPHAQAIQLPSGTLAISWAIRSGAEVKYDMATPITVRLESELVERMRLAAPDQRQRIAVQQEASFREGLIGYDPFTVVPRARVIILG